MSEQPRIEYIRLVGWLRSLPPAINNDTVEQIFDKARLSSTWK